MNSFLQFDQGTKIGDFVIEKYLGAGAFKMVYQADNNGFGISNKYPRKVALSIPHIQDNESRTLLKRECDTQKTLVHKNIVRMYGFEEIAGRFFSITEVAIGEPLNDLLKKNGHFPLDKAVDVIKQVGNALDYAHDGLAIHRDIKPSNMVMAEDGTVKVLDFGLARLMAHSHYKAATGLGTVAFMAPEQFSGATGFNADLWALGVTFYQLITNTHPFINSSEAELIRCILYEKPVLESIEIDDFDPKLAGIMRKILEKDPAKRYQRAADFVADLEAILRHAAAVSKTEGEIEVLLRAHFPLLFINTHEETRVLESLRKIHTTIDTKKELGFYLWKSTTGLIAPNGTVLPNSSGDPVAAIKYMVESSQMGMYVFLDIHRHFTPVIVRLVRDAIWTVKRARKSLVFISPVLGLPAELQSDATYIFYDTPEMDDLKKAIDSLQAELSSSKTEMVDSVVKEGLARAVAGLTGFEAERVLRRTYLNNKGFNHGCIKETLQQKKQIIRKAGILEFFESDQSFDSIGGLFLLKEWFHKRRQAFSVEGARFGLQPPRGVVLVGVPGCGKSLSAKALAGEWNTAIVRLDLGKIFNKYLGASEANLRKALHTAETVSPCILWIDELEKAFGGVGNKNDNGLSQRIFGIFLDWLSEKKSPVFVVATANDINRLPSEFTRKGRFDEIFFVGLPPDDERRQIFSIHIAKTGRQCKDYNLDALVNLSKGFTGAEIAESVTAGLYRSFEDGERVLTTEDIAVSLQETKPISRTRHKDITNLIAWARSNARPA